MRVAVSPMLSRGGDGGSVRSDQGRLTQPVYVPAEEAATLTSVATVLKPLEAPSGELTLSLSVTTEAGDTVLGKAQVVVAPR